MTAPFWSRAADLLQNRPSHPSYTFDVGEEHGVPYLRIYCAGGVDNKSGAKTAWHGRKWRLSPHMTDGEIVQTAFLALQTAVEHELREQFLFDGVSVFDPHYDIHKLVHLRKQPDSIKERAS